MYLVYCGYMEARAGFEPANSGFADRRLGPLGYRANFK